MIQRKLSKAQGFVVQGLASQLTQLQVQANEIQAALNEQAELARLKYKLPEGGAQFTQGAEGWAIVVTPVETKALEVPDPTPEMAAELEEIAKIEAETLRIKRGAGELMPRKPGPSETKAVEDE